MVPERGAVKGGIGDNRGKRAKKGGRKRSVHNTRVRTNEQEMKMHGGSVGVTQTTSVSHKIAGIVA